MNASNITAEAFAAAVGRPPVDDDLERANCPQAGTCGHMCCGWNVARNLPVTMTPELWDVPHDER